MIVLRCRGQLEDNVVDNLDRHRLDCAEVFDLIPILAISRGI
jgi:hypothetical protein